VNVVLDTNVWVSGLMHPQKNAGQILEKWKHKGFDIIVSPYILKEIEKVLCYPKIKKHLRWDNEKVSNFVNLIPIFTEVVDPKIITVEVKSDPKDSPILAVLIESRAHYLVTGDIDLLKMKENYNILSVSEFLSEIVDVTENSQMLQEAL